MKNIIKTIMGKINLRKFVPTPEEIKEGAIALTKTEIIEQLMAYKAQNPAKYEAKKEALFKRYGLSLDADLEPEKDESDVELEALKKKTKKSA